MYINTELKDIESEVCTISKMVKEHYKMLSLDYRCEYENAVEEAKTLDTKIKEELKNLKEMLNDYIGVEEKKFLGITYAIKGNIAFKSNFDDDTYFIVLNDNGSREFACTKKLFDNRLKKEIYSTNYCYSNEYAFWDEEK